jgi:hypothetical protein
MSNGINAIKGFDYQATVTLDLLFDHFDSRGPSARARPEGHEDTLSLPRRCTDPSREIC